MLVLSHLNLISLLRKFPKNPNRSSSTPKPKSNEYTLSSLLESPKNKPYEHTKSHFFTFIINKIPFGRDDLDKIHYYPFAQHHKKQFISKYCKEHNILNQEIVKQWYKNIIEDKVNHPIVIEAI